MIYVHNVKYYLERLDIIQIFALSPSVCLNDLPVWLQN